jgi:hypothetical protein
MSNRLSLRTLVFVGGAALMLVPALIAGSLYTGALQRRAEAMQVEKLTARGELSASLFARRLHQLWQEVDTLSRSIDIADLGGLRRDIDFIGRLDRRYSWIGMTDVQGRVLASLGGMLQGESVAQRPWFRRGLIGPTAIDVHEAQLLAKLLPASSEPYRFIDFAAPLRRGEGPPDGVLGAHLDWRWVQENLASLQAPGIDVLLLSRDRVVLYGPPNLLNKTLEIGSAQAANRVSSAVLDERWPDGKDYITVVVPTIGHADLPSFGWSLLIRQDIDGALGPTRELVRRFWTTLGAGALVALGLLFLGASWIATPVRRLAASAEAMISDAEPKAPYAETRYAEAERLSSALVRLQSRLWTAISRNQQ